MKHHCDLQVKQMPSSQQKCNVLASQVFGINEFAGIDALNRRVLAGRRRHKSVNVQRLRVNHIVNPLGFGLGNPLPETEDEAYVLLMGGVVVQPQSVSSELPFCDLLLCEEGAIVEDGTHAECHFAESAAELSR